MASAARVASLIIQRRERPSAQSLHKLLIPKKATPLLKQKMVINALQKILH